MEHACLMIGIEVKLAPELVEWKRPLSVETHTSPVTSGFTTILTGEYDDPRVPTGANVCAPSVDK